MSLLAAIVLLGILVFVHELGHFLMAKKLGVKVLKFSLGFGPKIIGKQLGETEYLISAVPLGGYVKMLGQSDVPSEEEEIPEAEKHRAFNSQSVSKRFLIVFIGPLSNILLSYIIYTLVLASSLPVNIPIIESFLPVVDILNEDSPAYNAGLSIGDRIKNINDRKIKTKVDVIDIVSKHPGEELTFIIERGEQTLQYKIIPNEVKLEGEDKPIIFGEIGIERDNYPVVGQVQEDTPAFNAGIKTGDRILKINGKNISRWEEMVLIVRKNAGKSLDFSIERDKVVLEYQIIPEVFEEVDGDKKETIGRIGVSKIGSNYFETIESSSVTEAFYKGAIVTYKMVLFIFDSIRVIITGDFSAKEIGGPVEIVKQSGRAASAGLLPYFLFMAIISVNLGIINLFPIPVLDGGHLLFFGIEAVRRKPLSENVMMTAQKIGLVFLLTLIVLITYNDIVRWITGG